MGDHTFTDLAQFRAGPTTGALLRKQYAATVEKALGDRHLAFTISTADVDRDGDTISAEGWDLGNYLKNPVVLWAHRYAEPPIARSVQLIPGAGRLRSVAEFTPEDLYPFGFMVYRLYTEGFLSAVSVGFAATEWAYNEGRGQGSMDFLRQELLEYSAVPVPANANALIEARSKGIDLAPLKAWAEELLDEHLEADAGLTRDLLEHAYRVAAADAQVVTLGTDPAAIVVDPVEVNAADEPAAVEEPATCADPANLDALLARLTSQVAALDQKIEYLLARLKRTEVDPLDRDEIAAPEAKAAEPAEKAPEPPSGLHPEDLRAAIRDAVQAEMASVRTKLTGRLPD